MKKQSKTLFRTLALMMSFVLAIYFLPLHGMAVVAETSPNVTATVAENIDNSTEPTILCEDVSLREENVKHFLMSNHTYRAVVYSTPVHYQQDGEWVDIDNTLTAQAASSGDDFSGQITTDGPFKVKFANNINSSKLVRIDKDDYRISWAYQSATKRNANGNVKAKVSANDAALDAVANTTSTITYDYVEENASLQYEVNPTGVKENIVVHSAADTYTYTFEFKTKGVSLNQCTDGSIEAIANDTDEIVFIIPQPFMTDAEGRYSEDVTYTLSNVKKNKATLTVTADANWINSEETVFPVTIDPVITTERDRADIDSAFVASGDPSDNFGGMNRSLLSVGRDSGGPDKTRTLIKFDLPEMAKGNMVIGADLAFLMWDSSNGTNADVQISAHVIAESWSATSVTWNNQPEYSSTISDYQFIPKNDIDKSTADWTYFDITGAVKGWYEGESNNGILVKANDETAYARCWFNSERYVESEDFDYRYPIIAIDYRNNNGLEDYWTYTSASAGSAGTMHVNDYTGNPVFVAPLFTSPSELMPLSLYAVYNGYASDLLHVAGKSSSSRTTLARGWRLNIQQTLLPSNEFKLSGESLEHYPYVYTDADGTDHYFVKKTKDGKTTYIDEDGLGLTLTIGDTTDFRYQVTDKDDNKMMFNSVGNLRRIEDANGNRIAIVYKEATDNYDAGKRIDYVADGTDHKYTFHYNDNDPENDNVQYITDRYGRRIVFARVSPSILEEIRYPDGTKSTFTYESTEPYSMLTVVDDADYRLKFDYTSAAKGKRVSKIREYSALGDSDSRALGQTVTFDRSKYNTTVIRANGSDDEYNTDDDMLTTCHFDNAGRLTSSYTKTADGAFAGAGVSRFTSVPAKSYESSLSTLNKQNRLLNSASFGRNAFDYITDSNFESGLTEWTKANPDASASFEITSAESYFGKKSAMISVSAVSATAGRAMLSQDITGLTSGGTYTFSAYVKTENLSQIYEGSHDGAFLRLYTQDSDTPTNAYSEHITEDTDTAFDNGWKRLTATITLPEDCTTVRAYIQLRNMTGTVYADGVQFEKDKYAHPVNLLENSGFDKASSGLPTSWTATNVSYSTSSGTVKQGVTDAYSQDGGHSVRVTGEAGKDKYLSQTVPVSGNPNETYIVSGWANGQAVSSTRHDNTKYEISVSVKYKQSDGTYRSEDKPAATFNPTVKGWQYAASTFALVSKENSKDTPVSITVRVRFAHQANAVYFDKLQLLRDNANSYTYDSEGNLISVSANAEQQSTMEYSGSDLVSSTDIAGYEYTYTYDDNHNVTSAESAGNVITKFTYNSMGQPRAVSVVNKKGNRGLKEVITYSEKDGAIEAGAHTVKVTDQNGRATTYSYDHRERLSTVTTPDGNSTVYSYVSDSNDRVDDVWVKHFDDASEEYDVLGHVSYAYDGNRLESLTYGDDTYTFEVDRFGNARSTSINGKALSVNTYASRNGKLEKVTYRNDDVRTYAYNWRGQTIGIGNGSHYMYRYIYDLNGTLTEFIDNLAERKTLYVQDSLGRPVRQTLQSLEGDHIGAVEYGYDDRNNVNRLAVNFGGHTHTAKYLYTTIDGITNGARFAAENLPTQYRYSNDRMANYEYTSLNMLKARTFTTQTPLTNTYEYYPSLREQSGEIVYFTSLLKNETINGIIYQYSYDAYGNITSIKKGSGESSLVNYRTYTYDHLSQLTGETYYDSTGAVTKTITYTYDGYGNILSRTVNGETVEYEYGTDADAGWSKLLKSYDGQNINYDEIGNPEYYLGADLTWTNGRQLKKYVKDDTTVTYTYDDAGMRTSKTVNGIESTYLYLDGKLHGEVRDGHHIHYSYDSYGNLSVIKYYTNDTDYYIYYVMTNVFGDVVSIHNANGTKVASYEYDAWGNVMAMTDTTGIGIAAINPIRYRGYYYDSETGLYYLSSRYYDPQVGRFINADGYVSTGQDITGYNMFTYCGNNPVSRIDMTGQSWSAFWSKVGDYALKFLAATFCSFQFEVGVGYGFDISERANGVEAGVGFYHDGLTIGSKNCETYTAIKGSLGGKVSFTKNIEASYATEYEHRFETNGDKDWDEHTTESAPWEVYACPKTTKDPFKFDVSLFEKIEGGLNEPLFIGISGSKHVGLGGHYMIGWDANEFWRVLTTDT